MSARSDTDWMEMAIAEARVAESRDEVPVGAVVVRAGKLVGAGCNRPIADCDPTAHAEIVALRAAGRSSGNYRLAGCTLFVTIEPCVMCVGAMIHARIERLVFGCVEPKTGAVVSRPIDLSAANHRFDVTAGVLEEDCGKLLKRFFAARRAAKPGGP